MNEVSFSFGAQRHLGATLTLPPDGHAPRMGVVLLNVGIIHRIGPHRFNTKLARALAQGGWATLRVDLSGQGDSGAPGDPLPFEQQAVADLQAAMDHFQRLCAVEQFVIAGIFARNGDVAATIGEVRAPGQIAIDAPTIALGRNARLDVGLHPFEIVPKHEVDNTGHSVGAID